MKHSFLRFRATVFSLSLEQRYYHFPLQELREYNNALALATYANIQAVSNLPAKPKYEGRLSPTEQESHHLSLTAIIP